ncbi:MAG: hypothetical protein KME28_27455 [Pelatocladus maniniholoensis HA4357-MV3]|jgi:hypothetical protein|uniref:Uncharacterized protein n=1 Tax=Pelatocladus maniniholoensis HA4357-MV3 TaxID=1117104 RepID=A0A9E3LW91_9NOST|nr:hypothetical protein [Pelatocladus maniniholoensis HA4357-MV3]
MSDYLNLNYQELKQYIKTHPDDEEAFQHFLTLMRAKPGVVVSTPEQLEVELKKRLVS